MRVIVTSWLLLENALGRYQVNRTKTGSRSLAGKFGKILPGDLSRGSYIPVQLSPGFSPTRFERLHSTACCSLVDTFNRSCSEAQLASKKSINAGALEAAGTTGRPEAAAITSPKNWRVRLGTWKSNAPRAHMRHSAREACYRPKTGWP